MCTQSRSRVDSKLLRIASRVILFRLQKTSTTILSQNQNCLADTLKNPTLWAVLTDQLSPEICVVWCGYGYGNTGDDLVLGVALTDLRPQFGSSIRILSPAPEQTRSYVSDTPVIWHPSSKPRRAREKWFWRLTAYAEKGGMNVFANRLYQAALKNPERVSDENAWLKTMATASRLHLAGGGYLTDKFHLRHFLRPLRLAQSRRIPISTSPLGLGPFRSLKNAMAVANCLRGAKLSVRDEDSLRFCQAHGLNAVETPDDGFRWQRVVALPTAPAVNPEKILGICVFSQHSTEWSDAVENWWVDCLRSLSRAFPDYRLEGFCFHTEKKMDYETARRLFVRAGLSAENVQPPQADYRRAILNLARYRAVVSSRFHAVVTASAMRLPCVATALDDYYEAKMRGALKYAPVPLSVVNPTRDSALSPAAWLKTELKPDS